MTIDLLSNPISFHDLAYEFATSGVYAIYCKHTDTYYIGQGVVILRRLVDHFAQLRERRHPNDLLQREFSELGEDEFVVALIADMTNGTHTDLIRRESEEIQRFKSHGKRLYNKVSGVIKLVPNPVNYETRQAEVKRSDGDRETYLTHVERISQAEPAVATCYDCGRVGLSQVDIFDCDDDQSRCQPCIENYLDKWRFAVTDERRLHQSVKPGSYRRWLVPSNASVHEHILLAVDSFAKRYGYAPGKVFINPTLDAPDYYRGIEIARGGIAVGRYIDIPIDYHD